MSKTTVSIGRKDYKFESGSVLLTGAKTTTLTFDSAIIALLLRFYDGNDRVHDVYYFNPTLKFWNNSGVTSDTFTQPFLGNMYDSTRQLNLTSTSANSVDMYSEAASGYTHTGEYIAILENEVDDVSIFLLNGTTLFTDGTPTTEVEGAIQTIETNKYKIKSNALINISGSTYVDISN